MHAWPRWQAGTCLAQMYRRVKLTACVLVSVCVFGLLGQTAWAGLGGVSPHARHAPHPSAIKTTHEIRPIFSLVE